MKIEIQDIPPSPNRVLGKHWSAKAGIKDKWILLVRSKILPCPMRIAAHKRVRITLHHSRLYDKDNAYAACKPVIDALKAWNLIWDDSLRFLALTVEQEKCRRKEQYTLIEVEP